MSNTPLADELSRLKAEEKAANEYAKAAQKAVSQEWEIGKELLSPYWDNGERDKAPSAEQLRERTDHFIKTLQDRGLALALDPGMPGHRALVPVDPALRERATTAHYEAAQTRTARITFEGRNASARHAEKSAAKAQEVRDALAGDDVDAIREALAT